MREIHTFSDTELNAGEIIERYEVISIGKSSECYIMSSQPYRVRVTRCERRPDKVGIWQVWGVIEW